MAMTMTGEVQLPAAQDTVWAKLIDPEVLKACIPGCESLDMLGENEFQAVATNKIGPVKARFKGKVRLTDLDPPNSYKISGEGDGGVAGFAKGGADRQPATEGRRHAARLQRRGADRRQARPARPAPHQRRGQEDGRPVLPEICRRGRRPAGGRLSRNMVLRLDHDGAAGSELFLFETIKSGQNGFESAPNAPQFR